MRHRAYSQREAERHALEHSIRPSDDGTYVILTMVGEVSMKEGMQALVEAHAFGGRLGTRLYLVDATGARNNERALSNFKWAQQEIPGRPEVDPSACIAAFVDPDDHSHDFFEAAVRGAGSDLTIFRDREQAIQHLRAAAQRPEQAKRRR